METLIIIRPVPSDIRGRRGKHGKNSTITTSRALNKPPPMGP
jgi:hypothetical protein